MDKLVVGINVYYVKEHFDEHKEDIVGGYWEARVVTGLEDECFKRFGCRQKDFDLEARSFGKERDLTVRREAIDGLITKLHGYKFHGTLHVMSTEDMEEYLNRLEARGKIVLRG